MQKLKNVIEVNNISKFFKLPQQQRSTLKEYVVELLSRHKSQKFEALKNNNFSVHRGEFFSIIGKNGSGKSTLLRVIAGILRPNEGSVEVHGSIAPFLELGVGFQPNLSGRNNVYLYGAILGLSRLEIDECFDEIFQFAELEDFKDQKLKNYSSGMQVRLAFSTAIQAKTDIILVDEVLAVGDVTFQKKCFEVFRELKNAGKTIVFVSHNLLVVENFSDRVLLLNRGSVDSIGEPKKVIQNYYRIMNKEGFDTGEKENQKNVRIRNVSFMNEKEEERKSFSTRERIIIRINVHARQTVRNAILGIEIHDETGAYLSGVNMKMDNTSVDEISGSRSIDFVIKNNPFLDGVYNITPAITDNEGNVVFDRLSRQYQLLIENKDGKRYHGSVSLQTHWRI